MNRLGNESSPYLLQHAHNPVDWYPWGPEALELSLDTDRPILLSIGYAACHWCHVMERESFEDEATAQLMTELYICIKVDREERPDLDDIYMSAVQMMTGHGGWPLTVFLTPELKPFYGGTYFPPEERMGMPAFKRLLINVEQAYRERRGEIESMADKVSKQINAGQPQLAVTKLLDRDLIHRAVAQLEQRFDPNYGGFSAAPKFPHATSIQLLLRYACRHSDDDLRHTAIFTLEQMAGGGLYDHVGGGFHRYSTDERWMVPHFEKMLYDNALLSLAYLEGMQATGSPELAHVAARTLDWVLREMQDPAGGYYSTLDADSEGVEGKFYVWKQTEIEELLGGNAGEFCGAYGVSERGNWEGSNILHLSRPLSEFLSTTNKNGVREPNDDGGMHVIEPEPEARLRARLERGLAMLLDARAGRLRPGLDDKVLADWNGLMIAAMVTGYRVLGCEEYRESAGRAARFVLEEMVVNDRLLHVHRAGQSKLLGYIDDYANMTWATLELFESTFEPSWLLAACTLADRMIELFWDESAGGFFFTGSDHEQLIARLKPAHDGATPPGNAVAATVLLRLGTLTDNNDYTACARDTLRAFHGQAHGLPSRFPQMLLALDYYLRAPREIAVVGNLQETTTRAALQRLWRRHAPQEVVVALDPSSPHAADLENSVPLLRGKTAGTGCTRYYACENYACSAPTENFDELWSKLVP